jgi:hypothetical protein
VVRIDSDLSRCGSVRRHVWQLPGKCGHRHAWYLSISYYCCIKGINSDFTFGVPFPVGIGGTVAFGKLAALIQCAALVPFNWSLIAVNILSVAGVVFSMVAIFYFLLREGFDRFSAAICCLGLAAIEPFIAIANQSKYEYITSLFPACSLLLLARRHLFLSGLISVLAIEVQPIGIMAPIYLISFEASRLVQTPQFRPELNRIVKLALGATLGLAVYFILHPNILSLLATSNADEWNAYSGHFLYGYFVEAKLYRHLPELAAFLVCLYVHLWNRDYKQWPFPIIATSATFFAGFLIRHANYFYTPFWYFPAFLLVFPDDPDSMECCVGSRARGDPVHSPIRSGVCRGAQICKTGRTADGASGDGQTRRRSEPGRIFWGLDILAGVSKIPPSNGLPLCSIHTPSHPGQFILFVAALLRSIRLNTDAPTSCRYWVICSKSTSFPGRGANT